MKSLKFDVPGGGRVSARLTAPARPEAVVVLAHGAGAGMDHPTMKALADVLNARGLAAFRFQFPYRERGSRRPDKPDVAVAAVEAAVGAAARALPGVPLLAGGKSFGGRMTTTAASRGKLPGVKGILCFGFPLHPPKKPSLSRAEHLADVPVPMLFLQGTRDDLADLKLVRQVAKAHSRLTLHVLEGADHGFAVLKSSGRTGAQVMEEIGDACRAFWKGLREESGGQNPPSR